MIGRKELWELSEEQGWVGVNWRSGAGGMFQIEGIIVQRPWARQDFDSLKNLKESHGMAGTQVRGEAGGSSGQTRGAARENEIFAFYFKGNGPAGICLDQICILNRPLWLLWI